MQKQFLDNTGLTELLNELGQYLKGKLDTLTFDTTPTVNSTNPVTSGGVKAALDVKADKTELPLVVHIDDTLLTCDTSIADIYTAYSVGRVVQMKIAGLSVLLSLVSSSSSSASFAVTDKGASLIVSGTNESSSDVWTIDSFVAQLKLTFDSTPTTGSQNPITSDGIKTAIDGKQDTLVSGTNIKTINNTSLLGNGNISIEPNEIVSITTSESSVSGGNNTVTITETNGTTTTFNVKNGVDGVSLGEVALVQTTGNSEESVMSQKSVTEYGRKVTAEDLNGTSEWIREKLTEEGWKFGKYIKTNGDLGDNANCCVSPFLPVSMSEHKGHKLILQYMYYIYSSWCACYYDSNKAYISGLYYKGIGTNTRTVTVGTSDSWANVAYVRYTFGSSKLSECFILDDDTGDYLFKGDAYISEICGNLNLSISSLDQTKGDSISTAMSQKAISDAINYNSDIQFGRCITITDSWNYFKLTPKAVSLLNASEQMTFMFSTKGTGFQADYRYFGFGNGNITSSNGTDTNGACIYWSYNRNCSANYVSYTLNKTSDNKYPVPDVWLVTWDRVKGIVKFYDRTKLVNTLEDDSYKKNYFVNSSGAMVIKGGDNTVRVYDVRLFDYDITTLFGNGTFTDEIERLDGAGTPSAFFLNNYTNAMEDGSFIVHTNTYGAGTGWTVTNNGSTRTYKNSTTTNVLPAGYYIGSDTRARIWKTTIEVVSGVVTFNKGNANWGSIHVYNSNNEEVDRTNVGVGTYTLVGENCSTGCWNVTRVSGDVELVETERSYKLMACVFHMKCDKLYNNKLYDDQTKTFFNFYSDRTFATVKTSNALSDVPQRKVRTDITALPYYTGDMAISGGKVYIGMPDYTWKQINNS